MHDKSKGASGAATSPACIGDTGLAGAVKELEHQHPEKWNDRGPHHTAPAPRHVALGGLRPTAGK